MLENYPHIARVVASGAVQQFVADWQDTVK